MGLVVADTENCKGNSLESKYFTIVVLPAPEGAQIIINFPSAIFLVA